MAKSPRNEFESFLGTVNLEGYRKKYRPIKIVEMDLPRDIQALELLYRVYWTERNFVDYNSFYMRYLKEKFELLENFRKRIMMCKKCFYLGLPARIYRTWASIITQIQGAYVAEDVFGAGTVEMSEELDHNGIDFRVTYKGRILNYQVNKESQSREVRVDKKSTKEIPGEFIGLPYFVPDEDVFKHPKKRNGEYKIGYIRFTENKNLKRLPNGFVIFTEEAFIGKRQQIDRMAKH